MRLLSLLFIFSLLKYELYSLEFPKDHGFHKDFRLEWCYFIGNLKSSQNEDIGYELSFFRAIVGEKEEIFPVHFAISETGKKIHTTTDTLHRRYGGLAEYDFKLIRAGDFKIEIQSPLEFRIIANPRNKKMNLDLHLKIQSINDILPQGKDGYSPKSRKYPNIYSYYYSIPRMETRGKIVSDSKDYQIVSGATWMDHEWSSPIAEKTDRIGARDTQWDWICIQLDDGTDIMAFNFRNTAGEKSESFGTLRDKTGKIQYFHKEGEVSFVSQEKKWKSKSTGKSYSLLWNLKLGNYDFQITPTFEEQEFVAFDSTGNSYWEGGVKILDRTGITGKGYLELK